MNMSTINLAPMNYWFDGLTKTYEIEHNQLPDQFSEYLLTGHCCVRSSCDWERWMWRHWLCVCDRTYALYTKSQLKTRSQLIREQKNNKNKNKKERCKSAANLCPYRWVKWLHTIRRCAPIHFAWIRKKRSFFEIGRRMKPQWGRINEHQ